MIRATVGAETDNRETIAPVKIIKVEIEAIQ